MTRPIRVLHCPANMGGNVQGLVAAERRAGLESVAVAFESDAFGFPVDETLYPPGTGAVCRGVKRCGLLWRAIVQFDLVHFNFGRTICPLRPAARGVAGDSSVRFGFTRFGQRLLGMADLPLLKRLGKGIVVTYQGDDARQGDYCRAHFAISPAGEVERGYYSPETDAQKRDCIALMARYADRIYAVNPDLLHVLPSRASFLAYTSVDPREWMPVDARMDGGRPPVVLHAPSHRGVKGTRFVLAALDRLRAEGVAFELALVESLSHAEARRLYERADLLVDQLLCGWYGGVAVELMALGKPVIAYIREEDLGYISADMRAELPVISASPETIYRVLKEWLTIRRHELAALGRRSRAFVERWHDPARIAADLKQEYERILHPRSGTVPRPCAE